MAEEITEWSEAEGDIVREVFAQSTNPIEEDGYLCWTQEEVRSMLLRAVRLGAQSADKPESCVVHHTPPMDFAECDTHDTTFPVDGKCKWDGVESITEQLQEDAEMQRARAVLAEARLEAVNSQLGKLREVASVTRDYFSRRTESADVAVRNVHSIVTRG